LLGKCKKKLRREMVLEGLQFYRLGLKGFLGLETLFFLIVIRIVLKLLQIQSYYFLQFDFIIERQYNGFNGHILHFLNNLI
jgi:hypothetical protein